MFNDIEKTHITIDDFKEIYDVYFDSLCKYLNFYTKDANTIEDIVQAVFLKLWENKDVLEVSQFKAYLFRSVRNRILNLQRDEQNRYKLLEKWFEEQQYEKSNENDAFRIEELIQIAQNAIETLPPKCREIFLLSKTENLTYKQIAEQKQLSVKTVENQMGIALKKIREYLLTNVKYQYSYLLILMDVFRN